MQHFPQVLTCGFPQLEDREKSLKLLAGHDFFVGGTSTEEETMSLKFPTLIHNSQISYSFPIVLPISVKYFKRVVFSYALATELAEMEKRAVNDIFVILSDIWLDNEEVI